MPSAEIITIGTEILLGEIQDTNTVFIARQLKDIGVDLFRTHTVGDNAARIAQSICDSFERADIVITTGGLGPTIDDPTREAVALAVKSDLIFRDDLWQAIVEYFTRLNRMPGENNRRQAYIPRTAIPIHNPVGTAPGFIFSRNNRHIISLPGVPKEMEYLITHSVIPFIKTEYPLSQVIVSRLVRLAGIGESIVDSMISDLERLSNPTVGLTAKSGLVDIRIAAKADDAEAAQVMITRITGQLDRILNKYIYGYDSTTLTQALAGLFEPGVLPAVIECGTGGLFRHEFDSLRHLNSITDYEYLADAPLDPVAYLMKQADAWKKPLVTGLFFKDSEDMGNLDFYIYDGGMYNLVNRKIAGPRENRQTWAVNASLDILRRYLTDKNNEDK